MNVNEIKLFVEFELNKNQSGNTLNKDEYNLALKWANLAYFKQRYGLPEQYRPGQPLPSIAYEVTQQIIDDMSKFKVNRGGRDAPVLPIDRNGFAELPEDYVHYSSITYGTQPVEMLRDNQYWDRLGDSIKMPTKRDPVCTMYGNYIQFQPTDLGFVNFVYLRLPATPFWAATIVNDQYVWNQAGSTELEWPETSHTDIANLILQFASMNIRDFNMVNLSQQRKVEGI